MVWQDIFPILELPDLDRLSGVSPDFRNLQLLVNAESAVRRTGNINLYNEIGRRVVNQIKLPASDAAGVLNIEAGVWFYALRFVFTALG